MANNHPNAGFQPSRPSNLGRAGGNVELDDMSDDMSEDMSDDVTPIEPPRRKQRIDLHGAYVARPASATKPKNTKSKNYENVPVWRVQLPPSNVQGHPPSYAKNKGEIVFDEHMSVVKNPEEVEQLRYDALTQSGPQSIPSTQQGPVLPQQGPVLPQRGPVLPQQGPALPQLRPHLAHIPQPYTHNVQNTQPPRPYMPPAQQGYAPPQPSPYTTQPPQFTWPHTPATTPPIAQVGGIRLPPLREVLSNIFPPPTPRFVDHAQLNGANTPQIQTPPNITRPSTPYSTPYPQANVHSSWPLPGNAPSYPPAHNVADAQVNNTNINTWRVPLVQANAVPHPPEHTPQNAAVNSFQRVEVGNSPARPARAPTNQPRRRQRRAQPQSVHTQDDDIETRIAALENVMGRINLDFEHKKTESEARSFLRPVSDRRKAICISNFWNKTQEPAVLPLDWCRLCLVQCSESCIEIVSSDTFPDRLIQAIRRPFKKCRNPGVRNPDDTLCRYSCCDCFPRDSKLVRICNKCSASIQKRNLPASCRLTMMHVPCVHLFPSCLEKLRPLEERFLAVGCAFGMITKFTLDPLSDKWANNAYRKVTGHITVFANNTSRVAELLPRSVPDVLGDVHVIWCSPKRPEKADLIPFLGLRKTVMMDALLWLKSNNHLYYDVPLDDSFWDMWQDEEEILLPDIIPNVTHVTDVKAESADRATYVPASGNENPTYEDVGGPSRAAASERPDGIGEAGTEEGNRDEAWTEAFREVEGTLLANDVEDSGERDTHDEAAAMVGEGSGNDILLTTTSSGFFDLAGEMANDAEKARFVQESLRTEFSGGQANHEDITEKTRDGQPYFEVKLGSQFLDPRDPDFFASTFVQILPYGLGGPLARDAEETEELEAHREKNFGLQTWAAIKLQQHGALAATHPVFPFLVFNRILKDNSSRISTVQAKKSSFAQIRNICESITKEQLIGASDQLRDYKRVEDPEVRRLLKEISVFGRQQPFSNEEKIQARDKIKSLVVKHGAPSIWFTINPNDMSSPVRIRMGREFRSSRFLEELQRRINHHIIDPLRAQHKEINQDPVTAVLWFHIHMKAFFEELVRTSTKDGVFGPIDNYFGCIETNGRGAFHLHGFLWYHGNIGCENLLGKLVDHGTEEEIATFIQHVDEHFYEDFDENIAKERSETSRIVETPEHLRNNLAALEAEFKAEAHFVAHTTQAHKCTATCHKYCPKNREQRLGEDEQCRFGFPWKAVPFTHIDENGVIRIQRRDNNCTRWNPVIAAACRHNHDFTQILTTTQTLALFHYITDYATKVGSPTCQRPAMIAGILEELRKARLFAEDDDESGKARSFMLRISNRVFSERELSSLEVCNHILGYDMYYSSNAKWRWLHCETLYFAVRRQWPYLRQLAAEATDGDIEPAAEENMSYSAKGIKPSIINAYLHRGPVFEDLCLYDYASVVDVIPRPKRWTDRHVEFENPLKEQRFCQHIIAKNSVLTPLLTGQYPLSFHDENVYCRTAVIRLALFIPWQKFLPVESGTIIDIWEDLIRAAPSRVRFYNDNFSLLRKSREDAMRDREIWNARMDAKGDDVDGDVIYDTDAEPDEEVEEESEETKELRQLDELNVFTNSINSNIEHSLAAGTPIFEPSIVQLAQSFKAGDITKINDMPIVPELDCYRRLINDINLPALDSIATMNRTAKVVSKNIRAWKTELDILNTSKLREISGVDEERAMLPVGDSAEEGGEVRNDKPPTLPAGDSAEQGGEVRNNDPVLEAPARAAGRPTRITIEYYLGQTWADASAILAEKEGLNEKQAIALDIILRHLDRVDAFRTGADEAVGEGMPQLFHYLRGEGGTGKSVVLRTLIKALEGKGYRGRLQMTATSGCAAAQVDGITVHSAMGLFGDGRKSMSGAKAAIWKDADILVIDECSMMPGTLLCKIHEQLQAAREQPDADFGGMPIVILCGDFYQFGPVTGDSLLYPGRPSTREHFEETGEEFIIGNKKQHIGHNLWLKFTSVTILDQQMRTVDPQLAPLLRRLRDNEQTVEDADLLNSKLARPEDIKLSKDVKAICPLNKMRHVMNLQATLAFAKERKQMTWIFLSDHTPQGTDHAAALEAAYAAMDDSNLKVPAYLAFTKGMPMGITENSHQGLKMVNGAQYIAEGFLPDPKSTIFRAGADVFIVTGTPQTILVSSQSTRDIELSELDRGILPIFKIRVPATRGGKRPFDRTGFALTPTFAITDYKSQGSTLLGAFLSLTDRRSPKKGSDFVTTYVQLSRVVSLGGLYVLSLMDREHWMGLRLPFRMANGISRLTTLAQATLNRHRNASRSI